MTVTEIKTLLANDILQRPELLTDGSTVLLDAVILAQKRMMWDGNWRAMETHASISYTGGGTSGATMPGDYKSARNLWSGTVPLLRVTEDEALRIRGDAYRNRGDTTLATIAPRWYESERAVYVVPVPVATTNYRLDYYKFLTAYVSGSDHDFFSDTLPHVLVLGAAVVAATAVYEHELAAGFGQQYAAAFDAAMVRDRELRLGVPSGAIATAIQDNTGGQA